MSIFKRSNRQSGTDLSREQHTPEPERNSSSNSYNSTASSFSNSHNYSPTNIFVFPREKKRPPFLKDTSRQLEAIQSRIKVEVGTESDGSSDSDEIPPIFQPPPPFKFNLHQSRAARQGMIEDNSQTPGRTNLSPEYISAKRKRKRRRTEVTQTLNPNPEPENGRVVYDRTRKETDEIYFVYFFVVCGLISFLVYVSLLPVIVLYCLYAILHK